MATEMTQEQIAKEAEAARPIVLTLTMGKINYILAQLASCPYEKVYQPIQDLQQMVMAQLQVPEVANDTAAVDTGSSAKVEAPTVLQS